MSENENCVIKQEQYDSFTCLAGECSFTCCQEWDISVDPVTQEKWKEIRFSGNQCSLYSFTYRSGETRIIELNDEKKCPFLREDQLCQLVCDEGEEILSHTCHIFPRQIQNFSNRTEYSLVNLCPETIDLLAKTDHVSFSIEGEPVFGESEEEDAFLYELRGEVLTLLQNEDYFMDEALKMTAYLFFELYEQYYGDDTWVFDREQYFSEDVLTELKDSMMELEHDFYRQLKECNELFLDVCVNYMEKGLYAKQLSGAYERSEQLAVLLEEENAESEEVKKILSCYQIFRQKLDSYDSLFRNFFSVEVFNSLMKPQSDLQSAVVMLQWMILEYVALRHALFLVCLTRSSDGTITKKDKIPYELVREILVVFSRIMGYDEDTIFEYMEDCFEDLIWEYSYVDLIVM